MALGLVERPVTVWGSSSSSACSAWERRRHHQALRFQALFERRIPQMHPPAGMALCPSRCCSFPAHGAKGAFHPGHALPDWEARQSRSNCQVQVACSVRRMWRAPGRVALPAHFAAGIPGHAAGPMRDRQLLRDRQTAGFVRYVQSQECSENGCMHAACQHSPSGSTGAVCWPARGLTTEGCKAVPTR